MTPLMENILAEAAQGSILVSELWNLSKTVYFTWSWCRMSTLQAPNEDLTKPWDG